MKSDAIDHLLKDSKEDKNGEVLLRTVQTHCGFVCAGKRNEWLKRVDSEIVIPSCSVNTESSKIKSQSASEQQQTNVESEIKAKTEINKEFAAKDGESLIIADHINSEIRVTGQLSSVHFRRLANSQIYLECTGQQVRLSNCESCTLSFACAPKGIVLERCRGVLIRGPIPARIVRDFTPQPGNYLVE